MTKTHNVRPSGLYRPSFEHDSCGFGLIAQMDDRPSHWLVRTAVDSLARLTHRGAIAADGKSGDGCGLLLKKPHAYMETIAAREGIELETTFAVGMLFLNPDRGLAERARGILDESLSAEGMTVAGWREVPTDPSVCGREALASMPQIEQIFINAAPEMRADAFERRLYIARRRAEKRINGDDRVFYIPSLSSRVISYKGMVMAANLAQFYPDLEDDHLEASLCVFHQRFSTNTWPQWRLAQPFRYLAHNGEINTIQGNRNWIRARSAKLVSELLPDFESAFPLVYDHDSDSCSLDNVLEALLAGGMDVFRAMRVLVPPAWQNYDTMDADLKAFYEYHRMHMEPWDGPAGIVLTDGRYAACVMDRNGLRPARYVVTSDRHITLASEIGVYDYDPASVERKGRLKPGQMLAADTHTGELLLPRDIDTRLKSRHPYRKWLRANKSSIKSSLDS